MTSNDLKILHFKVTDDSTRVRLDAFVSSLGLGLTRSQAKKLIDDKLVRIVGRVSKPSTLLREGDDVEVKILPPKKVETKAENIPLDVLFEDRDIIVVNKPAGMVVHPAAGHFEGTLVNALLHHCSDLSGIGGEQKPGIVHRLDLGTSGVIVAAKNDAAHLSLSAQFKLRKVDKIYVALVAGNMRSLAGTIDKPIGRSTSDRKMISVRTRKARTALTKWKVVETFGRAAQWLEVVIKTGRTHQIRVHLADEGHPIVGDALYGGKKKLTAIKDGRAREILDSLGRPALHAWKLSIDHPSTGKRMTFEAPVPVDISSVLVRLRDR